jgi:hypothetical protein
VVPPPVVPGQPPHIEPDLSFLWDDDTIILTNRNDVITVRNPRRPGNAPRVVPGDAPASAAQPVPPVRRILRGGRRRR